MAKTRKRKRRSSIQKEAHGLLITAAGHNHQSPRLTRMAKENHGPHKRR